MKKIILLFFGLLFIIAGLIAQNIQGSSAPSLTATPTNSAYGNYGNNTPWFICWDDTYLYIGKTGGSASEATFLYLDIDPVTPANGGVSGGSNSDGTLVTTTDYGVTGTLPFRADIRIVITPSYLGYSTRNSSGGWNTEVNISTNNVGSSGGSVRAARFPWTSGSVLSGRPASFNWAGYCAYSTGIYDVIPSVTGNPSGNGASPRFYYYQTVATTTSSNTTNPFSSSFLSFETREAATFNMTSSTPTTIYDLNLGNVNSAVSLQNNLTVNNNVTVDKGTLNVSGNTARTLTMTNISGSANFQINTYSGGVNNGGRVYGTDNGTNNDLTLVISSGTVAWSSNAASGNSDDERKLFNCTVNSGCTLALNRGILVRYGTFSVVGTLQINSNGYVQATNGSAASYNATTGSLTYNNGGSYSTTNLEWPTSNSPKNVTIQNTSTSITLNSGKTISGNLTLTDGTLTVGANTLTYSGSAINRTSGSIDASNASATISFTNTSSVALPSSLFSGNINNLTLNGTGGVSLGSATTVAGSLTLTNGTLDVNGQSLTLAGTISRTSGSLSANGSGSTVVITGPSSISSGIISSNTVRNLTVNRSGGVSMGSDLTISGTYTASSGKLSISGNTLTLNGTVSGMNATNSFIGSNSSKLSITSTGSVGTLYFDQTTSADAGTTTGTNALQNLVVSGSGGSVTLGNKVNLLERLSVSAGTLNTGDALVLRSISGTSSNNTAYVDQVSGTISGQVTVERYVHKQSQGWRAITAPVTYNGISQGYVSGNWQSNFGFSGNYGTRITGPSATNGIDDVTVSASLMTYNSTSGAWNKVTNTTTETMAGANGNADNKGFFLFVRGDRTVTPNGYNPNAFVATTLAAKGKLQTGTQTFTYGGAANKAWLVGNPYACSVDMSTVTFNGSIPNFVYVWDPNRPSSYSGVTGAYVTFDRTSWGAPTAGSTTKYFQSGQCFFVVPTSASGVSVVFNESNKNISNQNNQTAGSANGLSDEFNIKLSYIKTDGSKAEIDGIRAKFGASYSTLVDADDAYKWSSADIENMSLARNNANLVIEARPHITNTDSLFLNITNLSIGSNYEFKINPVNFDASVSSCKLVDKFLNTETPISLTNTTLVSFNVTSVSGSNAAGRFYVVFNAAGSLPTSNSLTVKAYKQNNAVKIDWEAIAENNVKTYTVEKSADAASFTKLSEAAAKNGNTTNAYSIVDNNPVIGVNYYRIQSIQTNNNKAYSAIVRVEMSDKGVKSITVYPNPVKSNSNTIGLQMNNLTAGSYTAVLYNTAGQQVWMNTMNHNGSNGSTSLQLNKTLASGTYQLQLTDSKGNSYKQTVLVVE